MLRTICCQIRQLYKIHAASNYGLQTSEACLHQFIKIDCVTERKSFLSRNQNWTLTIILKYWWLSVRLHQRGHNTKSCSWEHIMSMKKQSPWVGFDLSQFKFTGNRTWQRITSLFVCHRGLQISHILVVCAWREYGLKVNIAFAGMAQKVLSRQWVDCNITLDM